MTTNTYNFAIKARTNDIVAFLSDLLESRNTPLNTYPDFKLKDMKWTVVNDDEQLVAGEFSTTAKSLKIADTDYLRDEYKATMKFKKVKND